MNSSAILRPVVFNIIAIVAMVISLALILSDSSLLSGETSGGVLVEELSTETDLVSASLVRAIQEDRAGRSQLVNVWLVMIAITILASIVANYLGRQRQQDNLERIRELEAQLRGQ